MDRLQDLKRLRVAMYQGSKDLSLKCVSENEATRVWFAVGYFGDLDAAVKVSRDLLPMHSIRVWVDWDAATREAVSFARLKCEVSGAQEIDNCHENNPARALMIALVSAIIHQEENNP